MLLPTPLPSESRAGYLASLVSVVCLLATLAVGGCSPLAAYNALIVTDDGAVLAAANVAYGSHPRQKVDVYVPTARVDSAPVVLVLYGGSWNSGRKEDYSFLGKALSSQGFVTVVADYRLVPEVRFPAFLQDSAAAAAWTYQNASRFGGDPGKLFLFGHSAGAYNAVMLALDNRYLKSAGLDPSVIRGVAALAGPYDFLPLDLDVTRAAFGNAPDQAATQPIHVVTAKAPPMLLATGADDTTVYPRNTHRLAAKLRDFGTAVSVKSYPHVSHVGILLALSRPFRREAPVLRDVTQFIGQGS